MDIVIGKVNFLLVQEKIKNMYIAIIRREFAVKNLNTNSGSLKGEEQLGMYEIMDGSPANGLHFKFSPIFIVL